MKKIFKLMILLIMLSPIWVSAEFGKFGNYTYGIKYSEAKKIVQEVMKSYYIRGGRIQYNYAKTEYPIGAPEEATKQDVLYSVCAAYTYSVHNQAFGMIYEDTKSQACEKCGGFWDKDKSVCLKSKDSEEVKDYSSCKDPKYYQMPRYNTDISDYAYSYWKKNIEQSGEHKLGDGTYLIYYQHRLNEDHYKEVDAGEGDYQKVDNDYNYVGEGKGNYVIDCKITNVNNDEGKIKYVYGDTDTKPQIDTLIENMRPGDLVVYSGHALIVYDVVTRVKDGKTVKDALILNSTKVASKEAITTRIEGTSNFWYGSFASAYGKNEKIDVNAEGTIKYRWLRDMKEFVDDSGNLRCKEHECAVIRTFYDDGNGNAVFNYEVDTKQYKAAKLRTQYPGLLIEKTVSVGDNNSVNLGDTLTYTIEITNNSYVTNNAKDAKDYGTFTISETIDENVEYVNSNGVFRDGKVYWEVSGIDVNVSSGGEILTEKIKLTYTVKVKQDIKKLNKTVTSNGVFYAGGDDSVTITTGTVKNPIIVKNSNPTKSFSECYDESIKTDKKGKEFIDLVYTCAYGEKYKLSFKEFTFTGMFEKTVGEKPKSQSRLNFKDIEKMDDKEKGIYKKFSKMILNNYFSGLVQSGGKYYLPRFDAGAKGRARTIISQDFKDGDVLIYTFPNSTGTVITYAYIYIDGVFKGVNELEYNATTKESYARNTFEHTFYSKDYSVLHASCGVASLSTFCDNIKEFANYQTLYDKNYYIIIRPQIDEIINIGFTKPTKTKYIQNYENLDLTGGKIVVTYNEAYSDVASDTINLSNSAVKVTGFDNSTLGTKTLTVKYGSDYTTTYDIEIVSKQAESIKLTAAPLKNKYIQDHENLDLTGGEIEVTYNDESKDKISLTNEKIKVAGFDNSSVGAKTLTVEYEGQTLTLNVEIIEKVVSEIKLSKNPTKTKYIQNYENLDLTGGELAVTYNEKLTDKISFTNEKVKVTGFDNSELGKQTLTVEYEGKTTTFEVEVISKSVSSIKISKLPIKNNYIQNYENLDLTGGELTVTYNDKTTAKISLTSEEVKVSGFDYSKLGKQTITVEYEGKTATFEIEILTKQINTIKITKVPSKVKFIKGTKELDLTGGELTVTYNDESIDVVSLTNEKVKVSGFDSSEYGVNTLTIEYLGRTATLNIEIISRTEVENPNTGAVIGIGLILIILGSGIFYTLTRKKSKFLRHN